MQDAEYTRLLRAVASIAIGAGVAARILAFGTVPPGLNQDEASIGYDAWCLAHFGVDRNGVLWPVNPINFGNGGNATYAYMAMPFVSFGMSPFTIRLPMLISALVSLLLVWALTRRLFGERAAWVTTAIVSLCPWHVMLSRWAFEGNALPFLFLCGLTLLIFSLEAAQKTAWLIAGCIVFGISVYSYGPAYMAVPVFIAASLASLLIGRKITLRQATLGALSFGVAIIPIALFVGVNMFHLNAIVIGPITVPRLPVQPEFVTNTSARSPLANLSNLLTLLITQRDGQVYNVTDPFGVLYSSVFFMFAGGFVLFALVLVARRQWHVERLLVPLWVIACIPTGIAEAPNINRVNLLIMGLVVAAGLALALVDKWIRGVVVLGILVLLFPFGFFVHAYFTTQRDKIAITFVDGLLPAIRYTQDNATPDAKICVSGLVNMPQVYTLFSDAKAPWNYIRTVQYANPNGPFRRVKSYGRYTFGLESCDFDHAQFVVSENEEQVSTRFRKVRSFGMFDVYAAPGS